MPEYRSLTSTAGRNRAGARALWRALEAYGLMATSADRGAVRDLSHLR